MGVEAAIRVDNAPCSWGVLEFDGLAHVPVTAHQFLDEVAASGYAGTELGDWGFLPMDPVALRDALHARGLALVAAFVPVAFKDARALGQGREEALAVARLLAQAASPDWRPLLVLADANGQDAVRTRWAGRITPSHGLSPEEWTTFARGVEEVARVVLHETGLRTAFHHHCAGYVETPDEIAALLERVDPRLVGLTFDTGHYAYGSGCQDGTAVLEGLKRFADRIWHVHFKDCDPVVASRARRETWDYFQAVRRGLFCELGQGCVDFAAVMRLLREHGYRGWIVVEQDVLPGMGTPAGSARRNREFLRRVGL
ncbi:MAG: TIM barrel protein [Ardenticatenia bacterium]|nr:TIM barrel protein [Ardenticatenia bacterium]